MAHFTELSRHAIDGIAADFGLTRVDGFTIVEAGTVNSNYRLETPSGRYFLRINEGKCERDVAFETELLATLVERGVNTPAPLSARDGRCYTEHQGKYITVFPWGRGRHLAADEVRVQDARAVGAALAQLHHCGEDLVDHSTPLGSYTFADLEQRYAQFADTSDPGLRDDLCDIASEIAYQRDRVPTLPQQIIHGDLFRDNVLFDVEAAPSEQVILLDFEQACAGAAVYDFCVVVCAWCYRNASFDSALVSGLYAGYAAQRPLSEPEIDVFYDQLRLAALRFTITRVTDVFLPFGHQADKDYRSYLRRLRWLRVRSSDAIAAWLA